VSSDSVTFEVSEHDLKAQTVRSAHVVVTEAGNRIYPVTLRYAWPSELDLMARLAGLELEDRWASWSKAPFTSDSTGHVSDGANPEKGAQQRVVHRGAGVRVRYQ
jgi:hypothetical protein